MVEQKLWDSLNREVLFMHLSAIVSMAEAVIKDSKRVLSAWLIWKGI